MATLVEKLQLPTTSYPQTYYLNKLNDKGSVYMTKQISVPTSILNYDSDEVLCDVVPTNISHILLGDHGCSIGM